MLKFYYKDPTLPLEWGIRPIKEECPDLCLVDLQNCHRIFDVPVNIYVEEEEAEPLQAIDSQGNPIEKEQEEEIRFILEGIDFEELGGNEIEGDGRKDCEGQGVEGVEFEGDGRQDCEGQGIEGQRMDRDEVERSDFQNITEKGKRKLYERFLNESSSEFDNSSDEDYVQFDPSKKDLIKKLKKVLKDKKNRQEQKKTRETESEKHEWASEDETEDDLVSLEGSEGSETEKHHVFKKSASTKNLNLVVGMKFENAAQFRGVLRDWCIRNGVDLEFLRNEAARVTAKCKSCEWRIHASPIQGGPTFQIKTIKGEHTCARTYDNKLANASYIAKRIENAIRDHPTIPVQQLKNRILSKCNVDVSRFKVMRAKKEALERIRGDDAKQYELLWDYCETVRKCNPGSKFLLRKVENFDPPVFERMYFSLWALKKGFLEGCRPIIGLDGCFLKTVYGGQLLVAVGRDGNDNMFPIAMAVVQVENRDTWGWFVGELLDDIGGMGTNKWSFISDRQKGLVEALKDLVPESEHIFCLRHMYENFKMKFKSVELKEYFWKAASTANKREFDGFMKKIEELDPKIKAEVETASEWLRKINPQHWARSHFPVQSKCDILVNNLCESFNNYILEARDKPIITIGSKRARLDDYVDDCYTNQILLFMKKSHKDLKPPYLELRATKCKARGRRQSPQTTQPPAPRYATQSNIAVHEDIPHGSQAPPPLSQEQPSAKAATQPSAPMQQQVGYQGPRNASLLGNVNPASSSVPATRRYNKRPSISEVLDKMKERQKRRQQD
ncbi:hypothetical protein Sango_1437800 [Sesamum angolense]|uniref:Transposase n=1 Tax=Sesamum angolense TaxID=2727404 RepID=A0AAE1WMT4_9LAMI|nr:hypothetical protein Sango_1437800 [Sesamum angolense]